MGGGNTDMYTLFVKECVTVKVGFLVSQLINHIFIGGFCPYPE